jgi:hypothetical protein
MLKDFGSSVSSAMYVDPLNGRRASYSRHACAGSRARQALANLYSNFKCKSVYASSTLLQYSTLVASSFCCSGCDVQHHTSTLFVCRITVYTSAPHKLSLSPSAQ